MSDPARWREGGHGTSERVRGLFLGARPTRGMTEAEKARAVAEIAQIAAAPVGMPVFVVATKVVAGVLVIGGAIGLLGRGAALVAPSSSTDGRSSGNGSQSVPMLASVGDKIRAITGRLSMRRDGEQASTEPDARSASLDPQKPQSTPTETSSGNGKSPARRPTKSAKSNAFNTSTPQDSLSREIAMIQSAQSPIDPAQALERLNEHTRIFPEGQLWREREIVAIDILIRMGRIEAASIRGEALLERVRGTAYEDKVRNRLRAAHAE